MSLLATTIWENRLKKFEKRQEWGAISIVKGDL